MPVSNVGKTLTLEPGRVYIILTDENEDVQFGVIDTLDYENEDHKFLACMARGMLEQAVRYPVETIDMGVHGFDRDYADPVGAPTEVEQQVDTDNVVVEGGNVVKFPKTIGNA